MTLDETIQKPLLTRKEFNFLNRHYYSNLHHKKPITEKLAKIIYTKLERNIPLSIDDFLQAKNLTKIAHTLKEKGIDFSFMEEVRLIKYHQELIALCSHEKAIINYGKQKVDKIKAHTEQHLLSLYADFQTTLGKSPLRTQSRKTALLDITTNLGKDIFRDELTKLYKGNLHAAYSLNKIANKMFLFSKDSREKMNNHLIIKLHKHLNKLKTVPKTTTNLKHHYKFVETMLYNVLGTLYLNKYYKYDKENRKKNLSKVNTYKGKVVSYFKNTEITLGKNNVDKKKLVVDSLLDLCIAEYEHKVRCASSRDHYFKSMKQINMRAESVNKLKGDLDKDIPWKRQKLKRINKYIHEYNVSKEDKMKNKGKPKNRKKDVRTFNVDRNKDKYPRQNGNPLVYTTKTESYIDDSGTDWKKKLRQA